MSAKWKFARLIVVGAMLALVAPEALRRFAAWLDAPLAANAMQQLAQQNERLKAQVAELAVEAGQRDTVWRRAKARVDSIRDTIPLWRHDTTYITRYEQRTDSALTACSELADSCERFRETALSQQRVADLHITSLQRELAAERRKQLWKRLGVNVGYGLSARGGVVLHGPQVNVGFRVWP